LSDPLISRREPRSAGTNPDKTAVTSVTNAAKARTEASTVVANRTGYGVRGMNAASSPEVQYESITPATPPATARTRFSMSS